MLFRSALPDDGREAVTLASINVNGLAAGADATLDQDVAITRRVTAGSYCLRAVADPTGSSMDENPGNNGRRGTCMALGGEPDLDLAVRDVSFTPDTVDAGQTVDVQATLQNVGADASGPAEIAIFLSQDAVFDAADPILDRWQAEPVVPGTDVDLARTVTVPVALDRNVGLWHVGVVVDPAVRIGNERTRENNTALAPTSLTVTGAKIGRAHV